MKKLFSSIVYLLFISVFNYASATGIDHTANGGGIQDPLTQEQKDCLGNLSKGKLEFDTLTTQVKTSLSNLVKSFSYDGVNYILFRFPNAVNYGLKIDGSKDSERRLQSMLHWDVTNGVARRAWARNNGAIESIKRAMEINSDLEVTVPELVDGSVLDAVFGSD